MNTYVALLLPIVLLVSHAPAQAATATGTFNVSAIVLTSCIIGVTPLAFGSYDPNSAIDNISTSIATVTCTGGSTYTIALNEGTGSGATFATRKMTSGGSTLNYSIYTNSAHTTIWGDGTATSSTVSGTSTLGVTTHTIYGLIPSSQAVNAATYNDTITVTLTY